MKNTLLDTAKYNLLVCLGASASIASELSETTLHSGKHDLDICLENRDLIILKYMPIAKKQALKYYTTAGCKEIHKIDFEDVYQQAKIGLIIATDKFLAKGEFSVYQFTNYAKTWIKKYCLEYINVNKEELSTGVRAAFEKRTSNFKFHRLDVGFENNDGEMYNSVSASLSSDSFADTHMHIAELLTSRKAFIDTVLLSMPKDCATAIKMSFGLGCKQLTNKEIASIMLCRANHVEALIAEGIESIKEHAATASFNYNQNDDCGMSFAEFKQMKNEPVNLEDAMYAMSPESLTFTKLGLSPELAVMF